MGILYQDFVCTTGGVPKMFTKVTEVILKEIRGIEVVKLSKVMLANYLLLEGRIVAQIQVAYDLIMAGFSMMQTKKKSYPYLRYDVKKNDDTCPCY